MQIGESMHEISTHVFWGKKEIYIKLSSTEVFTQSAILDVGKSKILSEADT